MEFFIVFMRFWKLSFSNEKYLYHNSAEFTNTFEKFQRKKKLDDTKYRFFTDSLLIWLLLHAIWIFILFAKLRKIFSFDNAPFDVFVWNFFTACKTKLMTATNFFDRKSFTIQIYIVNDFIYHLSVSFPSFFNSQKERKKYEKSRVVK